MESAMSGIIAAISVYRLLKGEKQLELPNTTMCGALTTYISTDDKKDFQPMGANFGIIPHEDVKIKNKQERYSKIAEKAIKGLKSVIGG